MRKRCITCNKRFQYMVLQTAAGPAYGAAPVCGCKKTQAPNAETLRAYARRDRRKAAEAAYDAIMAQPLDNFRPKPSHD